MIVGNIKPIIKDLIMGAGLTRDSALHRPNVTEITR